MTHFETGEKCPNKNCKGILETIIDGGCSCHINPPCSYCIDKNNHLSCNYCGIDPYEYKPREYEIVKYWDNIYDCTVKSDLTRTEAEKMLPSYKRNIYTTYGIRKTPTIKKTFLDWLKT